MEKILSRILSEMAQPDLYVSKLKDPRWVNLAHQVRRSKGYCNSCKKGGVPLSVHHSNYIYGKEPWEYGEQDLVCLCHNCHQLIHEVIKSYRAMASRCNAPTIAHIQLTLNECIKLHGELKTGVALVRFLQTGKYE